MCTFAQVQRILIENCHAFTPLAFLRVSQVHVSYGHGWVGPVICLTSPSSYNPNSMQSPCDLNHLENIFQKAPSHISMVLFVAQKPQAVYEYTLSH